MLLHGIMSTIAEFYSRNLATEVVKSATRVERMIVARNVDDLLTPAGAVA